MFQAIQRRVKRALLDLQTSLGQLLYTQQYAVPVLWAQRNRLEDEHVQSAAQQIDVLAHVKVLLGILGESLRQLLRIVKTTIGMCHCGPDLFELAAPTPTASR